MSPERTRSCTPNAGHPNRVKPLAVT
jgi:hypothetical protein